MSKFEAGKTYEGRMIVDADSIVRATIVKRTASTVTINSGRRCKIHKDSAGAEYIFPHGQYSMATIIRAGKEAA